MENFGVIQMDIREKTYYGLGKRFMGDLVVIMIELGFSQLEIKKVIEEEQR